jgi:phage gp29-like protein
MIRAFLSRLKRQSSVPAERIRMEMMSQWRPLELMTPASLATTLVQLKSGDPSVFSRLWDDARQRDDMIAAVEPKRRKAAARTPWEAIPLDDSDTAALHKGILEYFFDNCTYTDVLDEDKSGSLSALMRGMMLALGYGHSVQEVVWQPSPSGLTAEFRQLPLHFFERRTGRLRYLAQDGAYEGVALDPGGWVVTASDDVLGVASLVLYLFKHLPLRDWLIYCDRYTIPGLHGTTNAREGSKDWNNLRDALTHFGQDWTLITGQEAKVTPIDVSSKGQLPYPVLVDRCDRRMSALWRGGDLSTMSSGNATGASLQEGEGDVLLADDVMMLEEVINTRIVPWVIRYTVGEGVPRARFRLQYTDTKTDGSIKVDEFLIRNGVEIPKSYLREKYGRPAPKDGEEVAEPPPPQGPQPAAGMVHAQTQPPAPGHAMYTALAKDLQPLRKRIEDALALPDAEMKAALNALCGESAGLLRLMAESGEFEGALDEAMTRAFAQGVRSK